MDLNKDFPLLASAVGASNPSSSRNISPLTPVVSATVVNSAVPSHNLRPHSPVGTLPVSIIDLLESVTVPNNEHRLISASDTPARQEGVSFCLEGIIFLHQQWIPHHFLLLFSQ
jgi:hypothetical protein